MRTVKAQAVWADGRWEVYTEPGLGAFTVARTVNGARKNIREAVESSLDGEPFELDFRALRWFDSEWWQYDNQDERTRTSRRRAAMRELARDARLSGSPDVVSEFIEKR